MLKFNFLQFLFTFIFWKILLNPHVSFTRYRIWILIKFIHLSNLALLCRFIFLLAVLFALSFHLQYPTMQHWETNRINQNKQARKNYSHKNLFVIVRMKEKWKKQKQKQKRRVLINMEKQSRRKFFKSKIMLFFSIISRSVTSLVLWKNIFFTRQCN